ncbi:PIF1 DNA helicase/replication protein A1-like protein [Tanacetum coccineum]
MLIRKMGNELQEEVTVHTINNKRKANGNQVLLTSDITIDISKRAVGRPSIRRPLIEITGSSINELLNSKRKPGRPKKIQAVNAIQKETRTPTSLSLASIKSPNIVLSGPLMDLTLRPKGRPRKSDISTSTPLQQHTHLASLTPKSTLLNGSGIVNANI